MSIEPFFSQFTQIAVIREDDGDTLYALDGYGVVWTYWTGKSSDKKWRVIPGDRFIDPPGETPMSEPPL